MTVAVNGGSGTPTPTGTVTLTGGGYTSAAAALSAGSTTISIPAGALNSGADTLNVVYQGDPTYDSSAGSTTVTVSQLALMLSNVSQAAPGNSVTATATMSADNTYSGTMKLSCALTAAPSNAQGLPTCVLNPSYITIASGRSGTTIVTVHITAATITAAVQASTRNPGLLGGAGAVLAGVFMFGISSRRRRWMSMLVLLFAIAVAGTIGCGGSGSSFLPVGKSTPATTKGSYTFTVTGTDSANPTITVSTNFTITVQ